MGGAAPVALISAAWRRLERKRSFYRSEKSGRARERERRRAFRLSRARRALTRALTREEEPPSVHARAWKV